MKPHPKPVRDAANQLGSVTNLCALVGDSTADILSALSAGAVPIGYANKPGKKGALVATGALVVIDRMSELVDPLLSKKT